MSTITKLCVLSDEERVRSELTSFLDLTEKEYEISTSEWPITTRESFDLYAAEPSIYSIKEVIPGVTEIFINCFGLVKDLATAISKNLTTSLVVLHYQSVSDACYWAYYVNGDCLRELMQGDGELQIQNGKPLPFENEQPGNYIAEDNEESYYFFGDTSMDEYNKEVGIPVETYQQSDANWVNIEISNVEPAQLPAQTKETRIKKPWWKVW